MDVVIDFCARSSVGDSALRAHDEAAYLLEWALPAEAKKGDIGILFAGGRRRCYLGWEQSRRDDLRLIIDRVTRVAIAELSLWLAPWQPNPSGGFEGGFRYLAPSDLPNLSVGMRVDGVSPPLWARWHSAHADLRLVESRLTKANLPVQRHEGHLWLALDLEPDVGAATRQIASLASQVVKLYKVAVDWTDHLTASAADGRHDPHLRRPPSASTTARYPAYSRGVSAR